MPITLEQALFHRPDRLAPRLVSRSPGFADAWLEEAEHLIVGFGERKGGMPCPFTVFAKPLTAKHVAVVRVQDAGYPNGLRFHFLVVERKVYEAWIRDPFMLAEKVEPTWDVPGTESLANAISENPDTRLESTTAVKIALPTLSIPETSFSPRTLQQVQGVLKRIKAAALREDEDPEAPDFERTMENSESPALLGGAQILVDGGRLVFERPDGDLRMVSGLWLLLPEMTRCRLWPTSFAFSQDLEFDVLVAPRVDELVLESYTTEEQAADYPEGTYELALQHAAEQGTQQDLDVVFNRRDSRHTLRLALLLLALVSAVVLFSRWLDFGPSTPPPLTEQQQQAVHAAGIVGFGDPWGALGGILHGKTRWPAKENENERK